jgi:glycerol-3-phosphate dehydrogenase
MNAPAAPVAVIGGGVVGCAVAHALASRGVPVVLLEAQPGLALGASGANSGIVHTGFDSVPGELETAMILRSAQLRERLEGELGVPVRRCGARMVARDRGQRQAIAELARNAAVNGVRVSLDGEGSLHIPGESITDPVAFTLALAACAQAGGAHVRLGATVTGIAPARASGPPRARAAPVAAGVRLTLGGGEELSACAAVNCAGLFADEVAAMAGEHAFDIYPRKGEFLVLEPAGHDAPQEILLPVPSTRGKGVLVFRALDGHVLAGPTAREREDKRDWTVEHDAAQLILERAVPMWPALADMRQVGCYAGLRPAGRGANYVIERSRTVARLIHVAAIRSTGLTACLGIAEHVTGMLAQDGAITPGPPQPLRAAASQQPQQQPQPQWWRRAASHHHAQAAGR